MKTTTNAMRPDCTPICKPELIYQPDAPEDARYNVQLWHSYDGGRSFYYAGYGRFFKDFYEADQFIRQALNA